MYDTAFSAALYISDFFFYCLYLNTKDLRHLLGSRLSADSAGIDRSLSGNDCLGVSITAGISAATAIGAGQRVTNQWKFRILRDGKLLGNKTDPDTEKEVP